MPDRDDPKKSKLKLVVDNAGIAEQLQLAWEQDQKELREWPAMFATWLAEEALSSLREIYHSSQGEAHEMIGRIDGIMLIEEPLREELTDALDPALEDLVHAATFTFRNVPARRRFRDNNPDEPVPGLNAAREKFINAFTAYSVSSLKNSEELYVKGAIPDKETVRQHFTKFAEQIEEAVREVVREADKITRLQGKDELKK